MRKAIILIGHAATVAIALAAGMLLAQEKGEMDKVTIKTHAMTCRATATSRLP